MTLAAGTRLGPYEILALIGAGGMGQVFRARDTRLGREVAIKISAERFSDRFAREAHAIAALNHSNVCTLHDVGPDYLVMELVEGQVLNERIQQGALPLDETLRIAKQIAQALEAAHEKGIVHRDLKPANIKITPDGVVKVLDFGLAKLADPAGFDENPENSPTRSLARVTHAGVMMGTAAYMAPEQARGGSVDHRADVWAFGVVLYEMLTGERLFRGDTISDTLAAVLIKEPDWHALPATTPLRIRKLLRRCVERDRRQRLQAIGEARIAIDAPEDEVQPAPAADRIAVRSRGRWWAAIAVVAIAVSFTVGLRLNLPSSPPPLWRPVRFTTDSGLSDFAALSPDGKLVAYSSDRGLNGEPDLYVKQVAGGQAIRLTADGAGNTAPDFSPDGSKIVFRSNRDGGGIYEIPSFGGDVRLLAKDGLDPKVSPDGSQVAYWVGTPGVASAVPGSGTVWVVAAAGGQPQRVGTSFTAARSPIWSPDGKHLLVLGYTSPKAYEESSLDWWVVSTTGSDAVKTGAYDRLEKTGIQSRNLSVNGINPTIPTPNCWSANSAMVMFTAISGDAQDLWEIGISPRTERVTGVETRLTTGAGNAVHASCAPGGAIAFTNVDSRRDVWLLPVDVDVDHATSKGAPDRVTQGSAQREHASLSANGRYVSYASDQSGRQSAWVRDLVTGKESMVASLPFVERYPVTSPSGTRVAFSGLPTNARVVYVSAPGGTPEKLCDSCLRATDWSRDEKSLLTFGGTPYQIDLLDIASHRRAPLLKHASDNLLYGRFSPDNRWISFTVRTEPNRGYIAIAPFSGPRLVPEHEWIKITDAASQDWANWSPDGKTLYFTSARDGHQCLWAQRLDVVSGRPAGEPFALHHLHGRISYRDRGWSTGGGRIAMVLDEDAGNIWMMSRPAQR